MKGKKLLLLNNQRRRYDLSLFLLMIPGLLWIICFRLLPVTGILIAFKDYNLFDGFWKSEWVGLKHFKQMFSQARFLDVIKNTLEISLLKILILFPLPIILALLLNEFKSAKYKKICQIVIYLPHFLSFVVIHGIFTTILSTQGGLVNQFIGWLGFEPVNFYSNEYFRFVLIVTEGFKDAGWNTIVYLSALSALDADMFEAAEIDGASKFQQMIHITLPGMLPIIMLMLTLRLGNIMQAGTDQILVMYNPSVYKTGDVIGTFVYREGISSGNFSLSTAVGLFESVVAFVLVLGTNLFTKKAFDKGLW
ncbi:MAG: ABC transporter permease [Sphaerochaetaceae bacterium]